MTDRNWGKNNKGRSRGNKRERQGMRRNTSTTTDRIMIEGLNKQKRGRKSKRRKAEVQKSTTQRVSLIAVGKSGRKLES